MKTRQKYFIFGYLSLAVIVLLLLEIILPAGKKIKADLQQHNIGLVYKLGFLNINDTVKYVGIEKCRKCHEDVYQVYIQTGMGMSWGHANPQKSSAVFVPGKVLHDARSDFSYQPYWDGATMMVKEFRLDGKDTVYSRIEKVDYVVGSGQHTNSHLKWQNGYLTQVPFTYYTQIGLLDFPPGFEGGNNARFSRKIGFECISCHNSLPIPVQGSINKYKSIPNGINCERCHGAGELHVKAMEAGKITDIKKYADYTIVRPSRLPADLQEEICARCHSQGNSVLMKGKTFFDFRPGMQLKEVLFVFREKYENEEDAFWMETHPERMRKSKCWTGSRKDPSFDKMTCLTCHFTKSMMHQTYKHTAVDSFNNICMKCHNSNNGNFCTETPGARQSQQNNCFKCHMPKTGVMDIPHVAITDHYIRITNKWKEPVKSTKDINTGAFLGLKNMTSGKPDNYIMTKAFLYHYEKFYALPAILDSAFFYLQKLPADKYPDEWATYYYLRGNWQQLCQMAVKYKLLNNSDPVVLYETGQAFHNCGKNEMALKFYQLAVVLQPFNLDYRNKSGTELLQLKRYEEAKKEFEFILREDPSMVMANNNLGFIFLIEKNMDRADFYISKALYYDPDYLNAQLNKAKLMMASGRVGEASEYLRKLQKKNPGESQVQKLLEICRQMLPGN